MMYDTTLVIGWGAVLVIIGAILLYIMLTEPKDVGKGYEDPEDPYA